MFETVYGDKNFPKIAQQLEAPLDNREFEPFEESRQILSLRKQLLQNQDMPISPLRKGNRVSITSKTSVSAKNNQEYAILYGGDDDVFFPEDTQVPLAKLSDLIIREKEDQMINRPF